MGFIAAAVVGVAAAGATAYGAHKQGQAVKKAASSSKRRANAFAEDMQMRGDELRDDKLEDLKNLDGIIDEYGSGSFGDTNTLDNLRKAQEDFSQLAAGNFSAFEKELRTSMASALATTQGSPVGAFANVAAQDSLAYRQQGLSNAMGLTQNFNALGMDLAGAKFGVLDQHFNNYYNSEGRSVDAANQADMTRANQAGTSWAAIGSGLSSVANIGMAAYGAYQQSNYMQAATGAAQAASYSYQNASARPPGVSSAVQFVPQQQSYTPQAAANVYSPPVPVQNWQQPSLPSSYNPAVYRPYADPYRTPVDYSAAAYGAGYSVLPPL